MSFDVLILIRFRVELFATLNPETRVIVVISVYPILALDVFIRLT